MLREQIRANLDDRAVEAATFSHERNIHKLYAHRDGTTTWAEFPDRSSDISDPQAPGLQPVRTLCAVGTGGMACNCDWCQQVDSPAAQQAALDRDEPYDPAEKYATRQDAVAEAVANSDLGDIAAGLEADLDRIPKGYFDDEETA